MCAHNASLLGSSQGRTASSRKDVRPLFSEDDALSISDVMPAVICPSSLSDASLKIMSENHAQQRDARGGRDRRLDRLLGGGGVRCHLRRAARQSRQ